jgi:hypothetical protein
MDLDGHRQQDHLHLFFNTSFARNRNIDTEDPVTEAHNRC